MSEPVPLSLRGYRWLTAAATPLAPLLLAYRLRRGKELRERLRERMAETAITRPAGPLVWVHGASVGEIAAALPLIEHLDRRGLKVLVTSGTVTSAELAGQRLPAGVIHQFVPLDAPRFAHRFIAHWRPDLALFMESDLWPNLILETGRRGIPLVLVNGRLSERSLRRWRRLPRMIATLLGRFQLCLAQSREDGRRYAEIGAAVNITGNLKIDVPPPPADAKALAALEAALGERTVIGAASTHPGEEAILLDIVKRLQQRFAQRGLLLLLAPRHPERGAEIATAAEAVGLNACLRSAGRLPDPAHDVYVMDTVGELGLLYRAAPIVFIGGSLAAHGGQNPIEAAKLGAAILHGPNVWNFAEIYAALDADHGAEAVASAETLMARIEAWLRDPAARQRVAAAGRRTVEALGGALERTLAALDPYLRPLLAKRGHPDA